MRQVGPIRAALSNFVGLGLGYVYVGRIQLAFATIAAVFGVLALAGWTRLVFDPHTLYFVAIVTLSFGLFPVVHCALIASRNRATPAKIYNRWWIYLIWVIASGFISSVTIAIRPVWFGYEPFSIPSRSMAPTLQMGDLVMVDTWRFDRVEPRYGELIVFRVPGDVDVKYVKRIIGLPGDRIEIRDDVLFRNGQAIDETYIALTPGSPGTTRNFGPEVTPEGRYFVLGDNRHNSRDSRFFGPIGRDFLHGRLEHRWFAYNGRILWGRFPEILTEDGS